MMGFLAVAMSVMAGAGSSGASPVPVLVELFSSEGCSSCPPADALLKRFLRDQPVPGVQIVALAEHVDYWDNLGWRDPFSSRSFTERQERYAGRLASGVYTPQLVVAGSAHLVGSDEKAARAAIATAAIRMRGEISAHTVAGAPGALQVAAHWPGRIEADILVALVQDHATSRVARGENAGRTLEHVAIARALSAVGSGAGSFSGRVLVTGAGEADRAVVFIQERNGGRIQGATTVELHP
jgi:hypothetical protein